jgi:3-isopropylmalate/(R)-2-methylmalate dehydratase small subunit
LKLLFEFVNKDHKTKIVIDVEKQTISVPNKQISEMFDINPYKKICVMNGYDDIDYLLSLKKEIQTFEKKRKNDYSLSFE